MKTLAILGLVFLPSTAISVCPPSPSSLLPRFAYLRNNAKTFSSSKQAIFSTPFFDRTGTSGTLEALSDFWLFWVISLPVTAVTVTLWYFWQRNVVPPLDTSSVQATKQVEKEPSQFYVRRPRT